LTPYHVLHPDAQFAELMPSHASAPLAQEEEEEEEGGSPAHEPSAEEE
jgi:hypothetical protein